MNPALPFFPDMEKKLALDHTNHLMKELEYFVQSFDAKELISKMAIKSVTENVLYGNKIYLFTELPSLQLTVDLCLRNENHSKVIPNEKETSKVFQILDHFFESLKNSITFDAHGNELDSIFIKFAIRMQSMLLSINRERYSDQQEEHIRGIYLRLDDRFNKEFGFTITEALDFSNKLWYEFSLKVNSKKYNAVKNMMTKFGKSTSIANKKIKFTDQEMEGFVKNIHEEFSNPKELFIHSIPDLCEKYKFVPSKFINYVQTFCSKFGDAKINDRIPFGEFLINYKPIISLQKDKIFCPIHDLLFWNFHLMVDEVAKTYMKDKPKIFDDLRDIKGEYTEKQIALYLNKIFPSKCIHRKVHYSFEGKFPEVDLLIIFDNKILIIEAKSNRLTPSAKFGSELGLKTDLKKIVQEAFEQSSNCKRFLENTENPKFEDKDHNVLFSIDDISKRKIFQINVTLEPLGSISTILSKLEVLGLFTKGEYPWSVYLYDLDTITDILSRPSLFLNYVEQRMMAQNDAIFSAFEEIQLLYWYLNFVTLQPFGWKNENKSLSIVLTDQNAYKIFDDYYNGSGKKPKLNLDKKTLKTIIKLEQKKNFGYTDKVSQILLDYNIESNFGLGF